MKERKFKIVKVKKPKCLTTGSKKITVFRIAQMSIIRIFGMKVGSSRWKFRGHETPYDAFVYEEYKTKKKAKKAMKKLRRQQISN